MSWSANLDDGLGLNHGLGTGNNRLGLNHCGGLGLSSNYGLGLSNGSRLRNLYNLFKKAQ